MNAKDSNQAHDESAVEYDRLAHDYHWFPEILFGLCFEYIQPGERLLALGIGTGLCALPFAKTGLQVSGLDSSSEMLRVCRSKDIAVELKQFDICSGPWPYPDNYFDHVIACGMLHFLDDLDPIFQEVARVIRVSGLFAYTIKTPPPEHMPGTYLGKYSTEIISGVTIFSHHKAYLETLMAGYGFEQLKDLEFLAGVDQIERRDPYLALVTRKSKAGRKDNETSR
jgi:ubiquinone/menaquinone biosynthesis C-methylase UbiE